MYLNRARRISSFVLAAVALTTSTAVPASAQGSTGPDRTIAVTGAIDFRNAYMFRGIRQDDTGVVGWPYADFALRVYAGEGALKNVRAHVGTWNSLNSGWAGSGGPSGKRWYESDSYATLALGFGGGVNIGTTYTHYRSPNSMFTPVKEIAVRVAVDDRGALGRAAVTPYALVAFELDTKAGVGQVDGGPNAGRYLELGVAPGYALKRVGLGFPVKVGLSLGDYYESAGKDNRFGFVSVAGIVTVPLAGSTRLGSWNVHGGVEYQKLGTTTKAINNGDGSKTIESIGIGFSY